jgi:putative spermidine/putrescine transport system permease protein
VKSLSPKLAALLQGLLYTLPFAVIFYLSLAQNYQYPHLVPNSFTLSHWQILLEGNSGLVASLFLSVGLSLAVAALSTSLAFFSSRLLFYSRLRDVAQRLAFFPFVLTPVLYAVILQFYFLKIGLAGAVGGVILAQLLITFPFAFLFFNGFWNHRVKQMEGIVRTLGGNSRQLFWRFLAPYAKGALAVCFFQTFLISWFEYGLTTIIGIGKVKTLTLQVFQYLSESNLHLAAVSSVVLVLPPLILLFLNKKLLLGHEL